MRGRWRIWFHRSRSIAWMVIAILAGPMGWLDSVAFVAWASLYANVASDWSNSEAADDREILARLERIETLLRSLTDEHGHEA